MPPTPPPPTPTITKTRQQKFTEVYRNNAWKGKESLSGTGSNHSQTSMLRQVLPDLARQLDIHTIIDAPCGDMHWMKHIPWETLGIRYIGVDIVSDLIDRLEAEHDASHDGQPGLRFECLDLVTDILPRGDLIFCRDCLVHLPLTEIQIAVRNFIKSGATWLLTTTFPSTRENADVRWSGWRPLNLELAPLNFPKPARRIIEGCTENDGQYGDKSLGLWRLADLSTLFH